MIESALGVAGSYYYVAADDGVHGVELWASDGLAASPTLIELTPGAAGGAFAPDRFFVGPTSYWFSLETTQGRAIWRCARAD